MFKSKHIVRTMLSSGAVLALGVAAGQVIGPWSSQAFADATAPAAAEVAHNPAQTVHKSVVVNGVEVFYREAGPSDAPGVTTPQRRGPAPPSQSRTTGDRPSCCRHNLLC